MLSSDDLCVKPVEIQAKQFFKIVLVHTALRQTVPDGFHSPRAIQFLKVKWPFGANEVRSFLRLEFREVFFGKCQAPMVTIRPDADVVNTGYVYGVLNVLVLEVHCVIDLMRHERSHLRNAK